MINGNKTSSIAAVLALMCLSACTAKRQEVTTDLNAGLEVAAALERAYAARPSADPKVVADLTRLMTSSQTAVASWEASSSSSDEAVANAAISALVAYEASAQITP